MSSRSGHFSSSSHRGRTTETRARDDYGGKRKTLLPQSQERVSDEEAVRALQQEAAERQETQERERQQQSKRFKSESSRFDKRRKETNQTYSKPSNSSTRRERDENDYYGPASSQGHQDVNDNKYSEKGTDESVKKDKPNFGLSGALARDVGENGENNHMRKGILLKFQEPPEARIPNTFWRFYVFKDKPVDKKDDIKDDSQPLETLHISRQSAYLIGRNADICDIPILHASCSSQHAVLQYRALPSDEHGGKLLCKPYLMDLESTNGTFLNGVRLDAARYYPLQKGDVVRFAASTREYVLLTANTTSID